MSRAFIAALVWFSLSGCSQFQLPESLPSGEWNYRLLVNGVEAGSAAISNRKLNGGYEISSEMKIELAGVVTISGETIRETSDFKPVNLVSYSKIGGGGSVHETNTKAAFNGMDVEITINGIKASHKLKKPYILDGNYTLSKLIEGRFAPGMEAEAQIYHPAIELEDTVPVKTKVIGIETIELNGSKKRLIHIVQSIDGVKSVDLYIDSAGVSQKAVIQMLNLKIELIKK